jgi:hypothetical protein
MDFPTLITQGTKPIFPLEPDQLAFQFSSLVQPNMAHQLNPASLTRVPTWCRCAQPDITWCNRFSLTDPSSLWICPWCKELIGGDRSKVYPLQDSI